MGETTFLNVDLDIESKQDITLIVQSFGEQVVLMRHEFLADTYYASFETGYARLDEIIAEYVRLVQNLPSEAQIVWSQCKRTLDIGYRCGVEPYTFHSTLSSEIVTKIAALGATIVITLYADMDKEENR